MSEQYIPTLERELERRIPRPDGCGDGLYEAISYALTGGGKRIRPILTLEFCRLCGGTAEDALPFACAVEMIHCYSLVHDDMPCMDDDELRRGKPSVHKQFGEATALLVGDALLNGAFETCLSAQSVPAERVLEASRILARCAGAYGMIGGQYMDLQSEGKSIPVDTLMTLHGKKTGELIRAASLMGVVAAGGSPAQRQAADEYARNIGLAFQIVDDILDVTGDKEVLGKPVGSDEQKEKSTYVRFYGIEGAEKRVTELTGKAQQAIAIFGAEAAYLERLAVRLSVRRG